MNVETASESHLTPDEKRALVRNLFGREEPAPAKASTGVFNPTRTDLLRKFRLDEPMVKGSGHRLFDAQGREIPRFPVAVWRRPLRAEPAGALGDHPARGDRAARIDDPAARPAVRATARRAAWRDHTRRSRGLHLHQQRRRGGRGRDQAGTGAHRPADHPLDGQRFSRQDIGRLVRDWPAHVPEAVRRARPAFRLRPLRRPRRAGTAPRRRG